MSKNACAQFLPQGLQTPRVLLLSAQNAEGEYVGHLWIGLDRPGAPGSGWIYDIESAGYSITQIAMSKKLEVEEDSQ